MPTSKASGTWEGTLKGGRGTVEGDHAPEVPFSLGTRFEGLSGSNPEELIGAALAGCFSMALSLGLEQAGWRSAAEHPYQREGAPREGRRRLSRPRIELTTEVKASGGDAAKFKAVADETKRQCPVSKVLKGAEITLDAKLVT